MTWITNFGYFKVDEPVKSRRSVMPANAGIQNLLKILDPGFRRDDRKSEFRTFYGAVKVQDKK